MHVSHTAILRTALKSRTFSAVNAWVLRGYCDRLRKCMTLGTLSGITVIADSFGILALLQVFNADSFGIFALLQVLIAENVGILALFQALIADNFGIFSTLGKKTHPSRAWTYDLRLHFSLFHQLRHQFTKMITYKRDTTRNTGEVRRETCDRRRETGDVRRETWDRRQET